MNKVELKADKTIVILSTNEVGQRIAREQVLDKINGEKVIVEIPDNIRIITSSFVEGFLYALAEKMDKRDFFKKIEIQGTEKVVSSFNKFVAR